MFWNRKLVAPAEPSGTSIVGTIKGTRSVCNAGEDSRRVSRAPSTDSRPARYEVSPSRDEHGEVHAITRPPSTYSKLRSQRSIISSSTKSKFDDNESLIYYPALRYNSEAPSTIPSRSSVDDDSRTPHQQVDSASGSSVYEEADVSQPTNEKNETTTSVYKPQDPEEVVSSSSSSIFENAKPGIHLVLEIRAVEEAIASSATSINDEKQGWSTQITGWRFWAINISLGLGIFLSQMETTIVSTSLVSITNDLQGFKQVSWIVTAYLVTYTGFLAIISKMSDIFGRKSLTLLSFFFFVAFSLACGFAQDMDQLIIFRAFQGIGGGGIYAMAYVIFPEIGTPNMLAGYAAYLSLTSAMACLLGPLVGGAINEHTTWRWVFWINVPVGLIAMAMILISIPNNYPNPPHSSPYALPRQTLRQKLARVDGLGTMLLLGASVLLVTALEEGGTRFSWTSPIPVTFLAVSIALWIGFVFWERLLHGRGTKTKAEAMFPWDLMLNRFAMGCLWNAFFVGGMFLVLAISLPARFQVIHGDSPFTAGLRILPLTLSLPIGTVISGIAQSRLGVPPLYMFIVGGIIHTIGISLLSTVTVVDIAPTVYGYQITTGFGLGLSLATCIMTIPLVVTRQNMAVAMGSIGQFRMLGGAVILAIFANVLNAPVQDQLRPYLTAEQLQELSQSSAAVDYLPAILRAQVIGTYEKGYEEQLKVLIAFSGGAILSSMLLWERRPRRQVSQGNFA